MNKVDRELVFLGDYILVRQIDIKEVDIRMSVIILGRCKRYDVM